jgi:hypothetical protein
MTFSGAAKGYLYAYRDKGLELVASSPRTEPSETLERRVNEWVTAAFESEDLTTTASLDDAVQPAATDGLISFVEVVTSMRGDVVLAGVVALEPSRHPLSRVPKDILLAVAEELLRTGDASGKRLFSKQRG